MKKHAQFNNVVATTTTFFQQSSVCSTVGIAPPGYQATPHLSTLSPACYPYQNDPSRQTSCLSQSVLLVTCNMPVSPPSYMPVAQSTSLGMAQASDNPVAQSTSQCMSQAGGYQNQNYGNQGSVSQSSVNQDSVNLSSVNQSSGNRGSGYQGSRKQSSVNHGPANRNSLNQSSVNVGCKPHTLEKPQNIPPKLPVYVLGESFQNFITIYESIRKRYGMMDETAVRLPECLSPPAVSLCLSLPEGVRSNYTQTVAALRRFWTARPVL